MLKTEAHDKFRINFLFSTRSNFYCLVKEDDLAAFSCKKTDTRLKKFS